MTINTKTKLNSIPELITERVFPSSKGKGLGSAFRVQNLSQMISPNGGLPRCSEALTAQGPAKTNQPREQLPAPRTPRCSPSHGSHTDVPHFYPSSHPVLQSRCGGSWDSDRQTFVHSWLEGFQAFLLKKKKMGFYVSIVLLRKKKISPIPLVFQLPALRVPPQDQHLGYFQVSFVCFLS